MSFYNLKAKYGGPEVSEAKRLKALESENARLKRTQASCSRLGRPMTTPPAPNSRLGWMIPIVHAAAGSRCAALHRRLRAADRRHHRPGGHRQPPDSSSLWIKIGRQRHRTTSPLATLWNHVGFEAF